MSEKLLILGASFYQVPVIMKARNAGYSTVVVDYIAQSPGHKMADFSYVSDTSNFEQVLEIAHKENIAGIISPATDVAVTTAAYVAEEMGLRGVPLNSAKILSSKIRFREYQNTFGFKSPEFFILTDSSCVENLLLTELVFDKLRILKPENSSGSKGVFIIHSYMDCLKFLETSLGFSSSKKCILEEFIPGFQGTCEGFIYNGRIKVAMLTERLTSKDPYVATTGHIVPCNLSEEIKLKITLSIEQILTALDIYNSPFDCDFIVSDEDVYIIEISPRIGGNNITKLLETYLGWDYTLATINLALGKPISFDKLESQSGYLAQIILHCHNQGSLFYDQECIQSFKNSNWLHDLQIDRKIGELVTPFTNGRDRFGSVLIEAQNEFDLRQRIGVVNNLFKVSSEEYL